MKKIYLFRHGETNWNKNKDLKLSEEVHDVPLNDNGIQQAFGLAKNLQDKGIKKIYCSNLKRAQHTASIVNKLVNVEIEITNGLEEFSFYDSTVNGLTRQEVQELIGIEEFKMLRNTRNAMMDWRPLNCETRREARERFAKAIWYICEKDTNDIIGISSHGNILREFIRDLDYQDDEKIYNCEIVEAEFDGENIKVIQRIKTS